MTTKAQKTTKAKDDRIERGAHVVMAALGALAVAAMLAAFVFEAVRGGPATPVVTLAVAGIEQAGDSWVVRVRARNEGRRTAAGVVIEGRLVNGETSQVTLDYVPDRSSRTGGLVFRSRPAEENLSLRVLGYGDP